MKLTKGTDGVDKHHCFGIQPFHTKKQYALACSYGDAVDQWLKALETSGAKVVNSLFDMRSSLAAVNSNKLSVKLESTPLPRARTSIVHRFFGSPSTSASSDESDVTFSGDTNSKFNFEGYLTKIGNVRKNWRRRYFILRQV
jgi:hypothetical protein